MVSHSRHESAASHVDGCSAHASIYIHRAHTNTRTITNALGLCIPFPWLRFHFRSPPPASFASSPLLLRPARPAAGNPCLGSSATDFATCRQTDPFFQAHLAYAVSDCAGPPETGSSCDGRCDLESLPPYQAAPAASSPRGTFLTTSPTCQTCRLLQHNSSGPREKRREATAPSVSRRPTTIYDPITTMINCILSLPRTALTHFLF